MSAGDAFDYEGVRWGEETIRPGEAFRIELAPGGSRVRLTSVEMIRMRRRSPTGEGVAGATNRAPRTVSVRRL